MKERYIAKFQQGKTKLHLLELTTTETSNINESYYYLEEDKKIIYNNKRYQVRLNRKRIGTSISEYEMRKLFATYVQNIVLQLKIY